MIYLIATLTMKLEESEETKINFNKASLFHGAIMENVSCEFAEQMHISAIRPFSQSLNKDKTGTWFWKVNTLNKISYENIITKLLLKESIILTYNNLEIKIKNKELKQTSFEELFEKNYLTEKNSRYIAVEFVTPTAFKSGGKYINYPTTKLLFTSLINKYDSVSETTSVYDEQLIQELMNCTEIIKYNLKSINFQLEGVKIPAFIGKIELKVNGNNNIVGLANMLFDFAQYSGVGIKNALGMGSVNKLIKYF